MQMLNKQLNIKVGIILALQQLIIKLRNGQNY